LIVIFDMYDRCNMDSNNSSGGNMDIGGAVGEIDTRTIANRIIDEKHTNILSGATIRKVKQLINKFNNFHNSESKKFNKYERHRYKLLFDYERNELKPRFETIDDIFPYLAKIEQMGFTLYYYIDDDNPENNDFVYCLEYGQLRGDRVPQTLKYDRLDYKTMKDHQQIFKLANEMSAKMYEKLRERARAGLDRWARGETLPPIPPTIPKEHKFSLNGFNFTADDLGRNLILQYMEEKKRAPQLVACS